MVRSQSDRPEGPKTVQPPKTGKATVDLNELKKRRHLPAAEVFRIEEEEKNKNLPFPDPLDG